MSYKDKLPTVTELRKDYTEEFAELEGLTDTKSLESFYSKANGPEGSEALRQVARYARVRIIHSKVSSPAPVNVDQFVEDSIAERIWYAVGAVGKIDKKTQRLIEQHGYLGAMVEQLKPLSKVGAGNFEVLRKARIVDCTAEYCVWKWGQHLASPELNKRLSGLAKLHNFQ
jgi:hypothetical protein